MPVRRLVGPRIASPLLNASPARTLLFPENDARLGEIVRRKLDRDFVARDDADEMLAHFAGNMREHVSLTREIDPEHRPRQNLGHRALHHDLFFLWHRREIYSRRPPPQPRKNYSQSGSERA